jgi:hypothetical protein
MKLEYQAKQTRVKVRFRQQALGSLILALHAKLCKLFLPQSVRVRSAGEHGGDDVKGRWRGDSATRETA